MNEFHAVAKESDTRVDHVLNSWLAHSPLIASLEFTMAESRNYTGGCHCGEVRFEVTADISSVVSCNCSICQKRGALWVFVPADKFALRAGLEDLKDYQFGKKTIHHEFCPQCGVGAFSRGRTAQGTETVAVNVRCVDDLDITSLTLVSFDGRNL